MYTQNYDHIRSKITGYTVCPVSKPLEYDKEANELISKEAGLAYPVKDGIPVMLPEPVNLKKLII